MSRIFLHYGIHFLVPVAVGLIFYREYRLKAIIILLAGILIDADHLPASPVFDPQRCSIGFHALHTYWAIGAYCLLFFLPRTRIYGLAFLIHILADASDCWLLILEAK